MRSCEPTWGRRQPDTRGGIHGLDHIFDQRGQAAVHVFDFAGRLFETGGPGRLKSLESWLFSIPRYTGRHQ